MKTPYIGITDFENPQQVLDVRSIFDSCKPEPAHTLMVGAMMSRKTLKGLPTKYAEIFPRKERLVEIFSVSDRVMNTLHYADYDGGTTTRDLLDALSWCGPHLHALQFDMTWPNSYHLMEIQRAHPALKMILQIGKAAYEAEKDSVVDRLLCYQSSIDYVLLDMSVGKGVPLDPTLLNNLIAAIKKAAPQWDLGIAVAGGLGPGTVNTIKPLLDRWGASLSIDAQGKLRRSGSNIDPIDWERAKQYVLEALELFATSTP